MSQTKDRKKNIDHLIAKLILAGHLKVAKEQYTEFGKWFKKQAKTDEILAKYSDKSE